MKTKLCALALLLLPAHALAQQGAPPVARTIVGEAREVSFSAGTQKAEQTLTIKNVGKAQLDLRVIRIAPGSEGWQLTARVPPQTLQPDASIQVGVSFHPDPNGKRRQSFGALQVVS